MGVLRILSKAKRLPSTFTCAIGEVGANIRFVDYAMYRVRLMRHHGIEPYIVFDGGPLPAKKKTEVSRER